MSYRYINYLQNVIVKNITHSKNTTSTNHKKLLCAYISISYIIFLRVRFFDITMLFNTLIKLITYKLIQNQ